MNQQNNETTETLQRCLDQADALVSYSQQILAAAQLLHSGAVAGSSLQVLNHVRDAKASLRVAQARLSEFEAVFAAPPPQQSLGEQVQLDDAGAP
jgi:hypothetical protein